MKRGIVLHTNLVLLRQDINNGFLQLQGFFELSQHESRYRPVTQMSHAAL